ncbi:uncharacterized protein LOC131229715 isoform X2 [Magnolia sinica]|uniref:uncharacterized protein LOC131229715 isoform X2 n=1 Tax=Magnolia sinica TaxID=86752 RepID=UPI00265A2E71|nr:uncharacterized protein LOC131229715 isoform X2 [Magnolia sinica]
MASGGGHLIRCSLTTPTPNPTLTATPPPFLLSESIISTKTPRRNAIFLSIISSLITTPTPSQAFSLGIPGPKEWLKEQKKKASKFLLAPIDSSRQTLHSTFSLLSAMDSGSSTTTTDLEQVQTQLKSAARDCVPQQRNSFVAFQAQTGVEVCTFRLIVKNASSLLDDKDPVKLEAEAMLDNLIRQKLEDCLMDTITSIDKFEQGIKDCLDATATSLVESLICRKEKSQGRMGKACTTIVKK